MGLGTCSVCSGEDTRLEMSKTMTSATRTQNVLDALKLATCLGVAVTLLWRKKRRLGAEGKPLSEQIVDYPRGSETEFSMTGLSSSNTEDVNFPNARAENLPAPLGMAIATVMAKVKGLNISSTESSCIFLPLSVNAILEVPFLELISLVCSRGCNMKIIFVAVGVCLDIA